MEKNLGGRPRKFKSKEELSKAIDNYFNSCYKPVTYIDKVTGEQQIAIDKDGEIVLEQYRPFTMTGLADALDMSRQCLLNYSKDKMYFDTIMRAKRKCELYAEERLYDKDGCNGAKFSLSNNFDLWKEKQDIGIEQEKPFEVNIKVIK